MNSLKIKKFQFFVKDNWIVFVTFVVLIIMILLACYSFFTFQKGLDEKKTLQKELDLLKNRVDVMRSNNDLRLEQIQSYNKILSTLIPDQEDFFTIIYALEKISSETGFTISEYTINLAATSSERLSLVVRGKGDLSSFMEFLKSYNFVGGRLTTSEVVRFSGTSVNTEVNLNFYHKKYEFDNKIIPKISEQDLLDIEKIKNKITVNLSTPSNQEPGYDTKTNPFQ